MLSRLQITNYALIDSVDITFSPGFNVITGETGAGKSIMLGALSLILGGRADSRAVRRHESKSIIEATFRIDDNSAIRQFCADNDIDWDPDMCILRRELTPSGRSRTFINDTPVTVAQLREVAIHLVDIHSQHQNLLLADPAFQLQVLDNLAGNDARLRTYTTRYRKLREAMKALRGAKEQLRRSREDEEFTRFQFEQLDELRLVAGEQADLEQRRDLLANITDVKSRLSEATEDLDNGRGNACERIRNAISAISPLASTLTDGPSLIERLESAAIEIKDIAETLSDMDDRLDADPGELDAIEERLGDIYSMQARHHVDTVEALIDLRDELKSRLDSIETADDTIGELEKEARRAMALVKEAAAEITASRRKAASDLAGRLRSTAMPLGMKNLQVDVSVSAADISPTGADKVEFLFAFNKNQPLMPVSATASGGEISRLMLSLKSIIGQHIALPSIIFDEIDTGVSGDVANRMGEMMGEIGNRIQVIAITHLPQVAARGTNHYKVYKEDDESSTHTRIAHLSDEERVDELSVMLSGSASDEASRAAAKSLLDKR